MTRNPYRISNEDKFNSYPNELFSRGGRTPLRVKLLSKIFWRHSGVLFQGRAIQTIISRVGKCCLPQQRTAALEPRNQLCGPNIARGITTQAFIYPAKQPRLFTAIRTT